MIRDAISEDAALIRALIQELAEYEGKAGLVQTTEADIAHDGFGTNAKFQTFIAEWGSQAVGFTVFFPDYFTWRGSGMYLEDLYPLRCSRNAAAAASQPPGPYSMQYARSCGSLRSMRPSSAKAFRQVKLTIFA